MAIRNVVKKGDPILRKTCKEVKVVNDHIREILEDMKETMRQEKGVGIAAPQVGIMRRMFVAEPEPDVVYYMINPVITEKEGSVIMEEGCLSVPGLVGTVERPQRIKMTALDLDGNQQEYEFEDWYARVMCHEYDHLDGILYTDLATQVFDPSELEEEEDEE